MKRILLSVAALSSAIAMATPAVAAHASFYPSCTVYNSNATVPVSGECDPYYVNGVLVFNAIEVNPGH